MAAIAASSVSIAPARVAAVRQSRSRARAAVVVKASADERQVEATTSRRELAVKGFAALAAVAAVRPEPAHALFGFGGDKETQYAELTAGVIAQVRFTLDLPATSDEKAAAIEKTRKLTNDWVARYRRDKGITGRPSYGNVYSALNAVSGHYNNFGTKYPLPQKRKDRVLQEFETAEIALSRGR